MAIEDAARCWPDAWTATADVSAALTRYEDLRRDRTAGIQKGSRRNATVFHLRGVKAWLRNRAAKTAGGRALEALFSYDALSVARAEADRKR